MKLNATKRTKTKKTAYTRRINYLCCTVFTNRVATSEHWIGRYQHIIIAAATLVFGFKGLVCGLIFACAASSPPVEPCSTSSGQQHHANYDRSHNGARLRTVGYCTVVCGVFPAATTCNSRRTRSRRAHRGKG